MTGTVRSMDDIGAGDIAVGQKWYHAVTEVQRRRVYTVVHIEGDRVRLEHLEVEDESASFGALLADWVLVAEA